MSGWAKFTFEKVLPPLNSLITLKVEYLYTYAYMTGNQSL